MDSLHIILGLMGAYSIVGALYWRRKFDKAQHAAEDLLNLCRHGVASFDNGVWHSGMNEGEAMAGSVMADATRVLSKLPHACESLFPKADEDALPF